MPDVRHGRVLLHQQLHLPPAHRRRRVDDVVHQTQRRRRVEGHDGENPQARRPETLRRDPHPDVDHDLGRRGVHQEHDGVLRRPQHEGVALVRGVLSNRVHNLRRRASRAAAAARRRRAVRSRVHDERRDVGVRRHRRVRVRLVHERRERGFVDHRGSVLRRPRRRSGDAWTAVQPLRVHRRGGGAPRPRQRPRRHLRRVVRSLRPGGVAHIRRPAVLGRVPQAAGLPPDASRAELVRGGSGGRRGVHDGV
mmetsp:Transcript_3329/g.11173  ORF Transcript_3329/g.11173 Transcript_3329/m.11173 type:complete len:251 (-) Transcript_3329:386-1138(-)